MNEDGHRKWLDNFVLVYRRMRYQVSDEVFEAMKLRGLLMLEWTIGPTGDAAYVPSKRSSTLSFSYVAESLPCQRSKRLKI